MFKKIEDFSKGIVILVIILNILFTIAILIVFVTVGSEPSTLITAFFAFTVGELFALAFIKNTKEKHKNIDCFDENIEYEEEM